MADPVKNAIPGFNPNRGNFYVPRPDTPTTTTGGTGSGGSNSNAAPAVAAPDQQGTQPPAQPGMLSDFATVAGSNQPYAASYRRATGAPPADLAKLNADVAAARQRLGPWGSASADFVGSTANPTNLLSRIPYVGPGLAGASQEAFKDYGAGKDWPTIGKDAAIGFGIGEGSLGLVQPAVANTIARLTDVGGGAGLGALLGHNWGGEWTVPGMIGAGAALHKAADRVGEWAGSALDNPTARQAMQQLLYGGALTAKPDAMPPLPGFASMGN